MTSVLFVCVENSCRSQMAEAFARIYRQENAADLEIFSAGSAPSGVVNPKAVACMAEMGYDLTAHDSKSLDDIPDREFDAVITMGCGDKCPWVRARRREDWALPDPKHMAPREFAAVRDEIGQRVNDLLSVIC